MTPHYVGVCGRGEGGASGHVHVVVRQACLHEGMRKAHFRAIHSTISSTLDDTKDIVVTRVEDDLLNSGLERQSHVSEGE